MAWRRSARPTDLSSRSPALHGLAEMEPHHHYGRHHQPHLVQVLLFVVAHAEAVRRYLEASRWATHLTATTGGTTAARATTSSSLPRIRLLTGKGDVGSAGDALRAIDAMGLYRSEDAILLLDGCCVSNARVGSAIASHVARKKADADRDATFLTLLMTPATSASGGAAAPHEELAVTLDTATGQITSYDCNETAASLSAGAPPNARAAKLAASQRRDLRDSRVYVASQSALMHWTENYDYQHVRRDYIHNECLNAEFPFRFFAHVLGGPGGGGGGVYIAPVGDSRALAAVTTG